MTAPGLRERLTFGFEQTFTTPEWWTDPGFVATSDTPLKREKMRALAESLARVQGGRFHESLDIYQHLQFETFKADGSPSFVVTMDPGSIEVKTQPGLAAGLAGELAPLFEAAALSGVVPYRSWWYGVKTGTEGGCHVNMGGARPETNPLRLDPVLVLQYAAFFHNNPWIHYPFMGVDTGPGGNCMRMDEHALDPHARYVPGTLDSAERLAALAARIEAGQRPTAEEVAEHFRGSKLAEDKHSAPSLHKFRAPDFLLEDRAQEALRSPAEFALVAELRLRILETLEHLEAPGRIERLRDFGPELHREWLCSGRLWSEFGAMAARIGLDAEPYRVFFERQFPRLGAGEGAPEELEVREGRRPRVITDVQTRGPLLISKTVDTSYARLELAWTGPADCWVNGRIYPHGEWIRDGRRMRCLLLDYRKEGDRVIDLALVSQDRAGIVEKCRFSPKDMMFKPPAFEVPLPGEGAIPPGGKRFYFNVENDRRFWG